MPVTDTDATNRPTRWLRSTVEVTRQLLREWRDDRVSGLAAEVAFFGLLSLFPGLLALAGALGALQGVVGGEVAERAEAEVVGFLRRVLTEEADSTVEAVRRLFDAPAPGALTVGAAAALWAASRAFVAMINALDVAYDVEERRPYLRLRLQAIALAIGSVALGALMLAALVLGPLLGAGGDVADTLGLGATFATFWDVVRWPAAFLLMVLWAATLFHVGPNHRTPWRWDLPGAAVAAAGWAVTSLGLRAYLAVAAGSNQVLGALGGSLIVVLWLYLLGVSLLVGAELNAVLAVRHGVPQRPR